MSRTIVDTEVIKQAVAVASRAPSLHNSQPWTWVADGGELQLFADRSRVLRAADSAGREALVSCGAMLDHLRIAMAAAGWQSFVDRFPNPNDLSHLASVHFQRAGYVTDAMRARATAMLRRRTDRLPYRPPTDWDILRPVLRELVDSDVVHLHVIDEAGRRELARASRRTEALRRQDLEYQSELDWWTAPFELDEGIPRSALNSVPEADRVDVNRAFPIDGHHERRVATGPDQAAILVLSTPEDSREDALLAGEALSTVLLECTAVGLATCTVTHLTETEDGRAAITAALGTSRYPQALIRVGRAPALEQSPAPTPRRPVSDVLKFRR
ncbi:NAD(P)H nitroreductase [[Mycobacterium] wendilense]|uniref:NAD(P)H nitroreductase n=2 Tax=[Mycobacterium] wendilense TaxID=3064284 RepID=A0ABN9P5G2_9MYCO|nr:NAD(P)H nitroreductase [Mycolicibacterium sp. MU0050]